MVIAYHLIWTAYGFWLPNDIRGSTSRVLRNELLKELGEIHFGRKRLQPRSLELRELFSHAREVLAHPVLEFGASGVAAIADAFGHAIRGNGYTCYACAIMPDHVHVLIRKHRDTAERMIAALQRESHLRLCAQQLRDLEHPVWGGNGWKVFLEDADDIRRTVRYVDENPLKIRQPNQDWTFVTRYDGWVGGARDHRAGAEADGVDRQSQIRETASDSYRALANCAVPTTTVCYSVTPTTRRRYG